MKTIGIKLADGTFYPILEEGEPKTRKLNLTTAKDNQTKVQVDLYRSETGTMDDAEYVDTLEVTKLNPHPNGEPDLHLSVSLDENNELKAEVIDPETGEKSETQVQLVSRTLAERENADVDFSISETGIADSELTALEAQSQAEESADAFLTDDFSFDDFSDDAFASETAKKEEEKSAQVEKEINDVADTAALAATTSLDDISLDLPSFDDFGDSATKSVPDSADDFALDTEASNADDFATDAIVSDTVASDTGSDTLADTTIATGPSLDDFSLDLPDFDDTEFDTATTKSADPLADFTVADSAESTAADSDLNESDFTLPDFDDTSAESTDDLKDFFNDSTFESDDFSTKSAGLEATPSSAMDFSDLYDEETIAGEHSTPYGDEAEEVKKKTRVPVIICVVCAIICIIATLLILFVIPSKYNLIKSRNTRNAEKDSGWVKPKAEITLNEQEIPLDVKPVKPKPAPNPVPIEEPEPDVPSVVVTDAQEDKIVVAPKPTIVPVPAEKPKEKRDVRYRIKWGDTLWDISESYYKNPWKYHKIARYNKIKNPDLIISGTDILIPEE